MSDLAAPSGPDLLLRRRAGLARNWWALVIRGVIAGIFGVVAFVWPLLTLESVVLVFGIYCLVDGVFSIVAAFRALARHERWGWLALEGVVDLLAGFAALALPGLTVVVWIYVIAAWALVTGIFELIAAFRLDGSHGRWLLALAGLVSVVWAGLLLWWPAAGAVVLTYWLGAYAILFGSSLIALGWRLRARHKAAAGA